jgi:hypothetical protein
MRVTATEIQLVTILIAPVAALAGVWISPRLGADLERRRWLWQHRAEACLTVLRVAEELRFRAWHGDLPDPPHERIDLRPIAVAARQLELLGGQRTAAQVHSVLDRINQLVEAGRWAEVQVNDRTLQDLFAAHHALGVALDELAQVCKVELRR